MTSDSSASAKWPESIGGPILCLAASRLLEGLAAGTVFIALPHWIATESALGSFYGTSATSVGTLVSAFGLALALGQLSAGRLADQVGGRRRLAVLGLIAFSLISLLLSLTTTFSQLFVLRGLQGLSAALVVPTTVSLAAALVEPEQRGRALGLFESVKLLGISLGPLVGGGLLDVLSVEVTFCVSALLALGACVPLLLLPGEGRSSGGLAIPGRPRPRQSESRPRCNDWLPSACLAFGAFVASGAATSLAVLQNEFAAKLGQTSLGFGLALSAMLFARMILSWPAGRLADRVSRRALLLIGLSTLAISTHLLGWARSTTELVLLRICMGAGMAIFSTTSLAMASGGGGERGGIYRVSWVTSGFAFGVGIGPVVTGICADRIGLQTPFTVWSLMAIVAMLQVACMRRAQAADSAVVRL